LNQILETPLSPPTSRSLVLSHLLHCGYINTYAALTLPNSPPDSAQIRAMVRRLIKLGQIQEARKQIGPIEKNIVELALIVQEYLEKVRDKDVDGALEIMENGMRQYWNNGSGGIFDRFIEVLFPFLFFLELRYCFCVLCILILNFIFRFPYLFTVFTFFFFPFFFKLKISI